MKTSLFHFPWGFPSDLSSPFSTPFGAPRRGPGGGLAAHGGGLFGRRVSLHPLGFGAAWADDSDDGNHRKITIVMYQYRAIIRFLRAVPSHHF